LRVGGVAAGAGAEEGRGTGAGVLDIAGGNGELAFELLNISGVPVTVVDPRPMRLDKYVKRFRKGFYHRNRAPAMDAGCTRRPPGSVLTAPGHLRLFFHAGMFDTDTVPDASARRIAVEESWGLANNSRWSRRGLVGVDGGDDGSDSGGVGDGGANKPGSEGGGGGSGGGGGGSDGSIGGGGGSAGENGRDITSGARQVEYKRRGAPLRQRTAFTGMATTTDTSAPTATAATTAEEEEEGDEQREEATAKASNTANADHAVAAVVAAADADACEPAALDAAGTFAALEILLERCSVVVGLHTDQATDAAVDFALSRGRGSYTPRGVAHSDRGTFQGGAYGPRGIQLGQMYIT